MTRIIFAFISVLIASIGFYFAREAKRVRYVNEKSKNIWDPDIEAYDPSDIGGGGGPIAEDPAPPQGPVLS